MRDLSTFLHDYGDSHRHPVNQWVHIFCVPAIFVSTLGPVSYTHLTLPTILLV